MDNDETSEQEFQKATEVLCVDGGASLHTSHRQLKQWVREVNAAEPPVESRRLLKWSSTPIIFDLEDHPDRSTCTRPTRWPPPPPSSSPAPARSWRWASLGRTASGRTRRRSTCRSTRRWAAARATSPVRRSSRSWPRPP